MPDGEASDHQTHPDLQELEPTDIHPLDVKKSHPPEEGGTTKRKTRRGTRGKGRKIICDKRPNDKLAEERCSSGHMNNMQNCGHEPSEVVRPRQGDRESNDVPHTFTVWKTGYTEQTAEEGLRWWQDYKESCCVGHSWAQEETGQGCDVPWFNLTYWRTGFFLNGANEHLRPGRRTETKNLRETENPREAQNPRQTENPREM